MRVSLFLQLSVAGLVALLPVASRLAAQTAEPNGTAWSYVGKNGPVNWGKLDPAYRACAAGREQSPIDIRGARLNKALKPIEFHYMAATVKVVNNGHTAMAEVKPGSYILVDGVRYDLVQFHFHHPSEEAVKGRLTEMDAHLVHRSADGKLAVVAVRLKEDLNTANTVLATLWAHLPKTTGGEDKTTEMVNPAGLLPADRGYWTYPGSLTTPPCTEGVKWLVMEDTVPVSREQVRTFSLLFKINSRPLQDEHGRKIEASE
jgi:carbonic anhydrase